MTVLLPLLVCLTLAFSPALRAQTFTVGVELQPYMPYSNVQDGQYLGYGRELLDAFVYRDFIIANDISGNFRFGRQVVHENLDLDLYRGEILAVVGGSGSGKSVLLRSIIGLRRPNEGQIKVFGQDLTGLREEQRSLVERRFGVLFQKGALFSSLTVTEKGYPFVRNICMAFDLDLHKYQGGKPLFSATI